MQFWWMRNEYNFVRNLRVIPYKLNGVYLNLYNKKLESAFQHTVPPPQQWLLHEQACPSGNRLHWRSKRNITPIFGAKNFSAETRVWWNFKGAKTGFPVLNAPKRNCQRDKCASRGRGGRASRPKGFPESRCLFKIRQSSLGREASFWSRRLPDGVFAYRVACLLTLIWIYKYPYMHANRALHNATMTRFRLGSISYIGFADLIRPSLCNARWECALERKTTHP